MIQENRLEGKSSMTLQGFLVASLLLYCFVGASCAVSFSSLRNTLVVSASTTDGQVLKAGEDMITVTWSVNTSFPSGTDSNYAEVQVKLCYAPISQKDRGWRKTVDNLTKDKTCQHKVVTRPYSASNNTYTWTVLKDVPTATYFIRAYVHNANKEVVAFGQTTDKGKATNLFRVQAITGRHVSMDAAAVCFSAFSVVSLFGFFYMEQRKGKSVSK